MGSRSFKLWVKKEKMVSLEKKTDYISKIKNVPKLEAFYNLLFSRKTYVSQNKNLSESDRIYYGLLNGIIANDKTEFRNFYDKKSKANPQKGSSSPFINDDFLIFLVILGVELFNIDKGWINHIISLRARNKITITFENILNENYYSKSNSSEVVLVFFQLVKQSLINNDFLTTTYKNITKIDSVFEMKNDFHIICILKAYDIIIELKEAIPGNKIKLLKEFDIKFRKRIKYLNWFIQACVFFLFLYLLGKYLSSIPETEQFFKKYGFIFTILGALGLTISGNIIPYIKKKSANFLMKLFGYPKELIKSDKKNE
jgi:hypothetical protein